MRYVTVKIRLEDLEELYALGYVVELPTSKSPKINSNKIIGKRLDQDWWIPEELGDWAMTELGWDVKKVVSTAHKFKDYWLAVPGAKGVKVDWSSTWRNWCRRDSEGGFK